ncbi:SGNH/GDSL hydrolase family protein [Sphingomonas sp. SUN039]|uniref:SGNH/GDSL hydrolase family protein n=1 Tax=Sphingomonas sp. SUN039 TaxID=2937787 RepID=UPI002164E4DF|nr:SGNH/GDSL hydrolase family protein [Sphingomonas sp. SUN039]UVO53648.1 SGNH/GDSL hydrolase family protein [Sphingomonas sp. SUN039]
MWLLLFLAGVVFLGGASLVKQMRTPPVTNSAYVALGSSYAAGLGLGPRAPGSPIVSGRTVNGYPQQLARLLKVPSFSDMSSSGSTVQHVLHGGQMLLGPQIDALGPDTRLVTLTAGGNDVGYVGDLTAMAYANRGGVVGVLVGVFWKGAKPLAERKFSELESNLTATLAEIRKRSPRARIVVVTYPTILPDSGTCATLGISKEQADLMRAVGVKLAEATRTAAIKAGVITVDMASRSQGHDACSSDPWVNGFRPKAGADFHPTLAGARATAQAVAATIR